MATRYHQNCLRRSPHRCLANYVEVRSVWPSRNIVEFDRAISASRGPLELMIVMRYASRS